MNREQVTVNNGITKSLWLKVITICCFILAFIFSGCSELLDLTGEQTDNESGKEFIRIYIGESNSSARTVQPGWNAIEGYMLTFSGPSTVEPMVITEGNSADVYLTDGNWTISARAYKLGGTIGNNSDVIASGSITISFSSGVVTGTVPPIILRYWWSSTSDVGILNYNITFDSGISGYMRLWSYGDPVSSFGENGELILSDSIDDELTLAVGQYIAEVRLENENGNVAFYREVIQIWRDTTTSLIFNPSVFFDPNMQLPTTTMDYGDFNVTATSIVLPDYTNGILTILSNGIYTIGMRSGVNSTTTNRIVVASGVTADITISGVNINVSGTSSTCAFDMTGATVNLTLVGENFLSSGNNRAGIQAPVGSSLNITEASSGSLTANGGSYGAGIGGGGSGSTNTSSGTISIYGGIVTATGGDAGAGIGGGGNGNTSCGTINIFGGTVTATGGNRSGSSIGCAGIGDGSGGGGVNFSSGGIINISGGTVTATGGAHGPGIGGYVYTNNTSYGHYTIKISGGNIIANGGISSRNYDGNYLDSIICISGGTVTTNYTGYSNANGSIYTSGTINISNGNVTINTESYSDYCISGSTINISGGTVTTIDPFIYRGYSIIGYSEINISGGLVTAPRGIIGDNTISITGNAVVFTSYTYSFSNNVNYGPSIVFIGNNGTMYGNVILDRNITISSNRILGIANGQTLTIQSGNTLTNNGSIIMYGGNIVGTIAGNQLLEPAFTISGSSSYTYASGILTITGNGTYTIGMRTGVTSTTSERIIIAPMVNANITLSDVNIDISDLANFNNIRIDAFNMTGGSTVNLTLLGENVLRSDSQIGLGVYEESTLNITSASTGTLTATGIYGIGGWGSDECIMNIFGGTINARGIRGSIGTISGNAVVFASSIQAELPTGSNLGPAIVFIGNNGTMYGNVTLQQDVTFPTGRILPISAGQSLIIPSGITLTNNGTINNSGTINRLGVITGSGSITGNQPVP